mmetsp:Transcript_3550/g.11018  ORF Transcript_3550/g.11018 Transcript_3550/m.11018 type:complete len:941 (+) Transcript_3550:3836-6658(+)
MRALGQLIFELLGGTLEAAHLGAQRLDAVQDLRVLDLRTTPQHQRTARLAGAVHRLEGEVRVGQVLRDQLLAHALRDRLAVEVDHARDEVLVGDGAADVRPAQLALAQHQAHRLQCVLHLGRRLGERLDLVQMRLANAAHALLGRLDRRLGLAEVGVGALLLGLDDHLLLAHLLLQLQRLLALRLGHRLLLHHLLQLLVGQLVLLLQLVALHAQRRLQVGHLLFGVAQLLQTDVQMQLLLLELLALLAQQLGHLANKVEVVARRHVVVQALLEQAAIGRVHGAVHVHQRAEHGVAVRHRCALARAIQLHAGQLREEVGRTILGAVQVTVARELLRHLVERLRAPLAEPVDHTAVEERRRGGGAVVKVRAGRVHGEHDVQVATHVLREPAEELLVRVQHQAGLEHRVLDRVHQIVVVVALEEAGHVAAGQQRVHALQEAAVQHVALVKDEADLLAGAAGTLHHQAEIAVKVLGRVAVVHLDGEDTHAVHPGDEARQHRLAAAAHADQQRVALRLPQHSVDAQDVVEHLVEEHQRHVQLLLVEDAQLGLHLAAQLLAIHTHVVLTGPGGEEDRALRGLRPGRREVARHTGVQRAIGPLALVRRHQSVLEETQALVCPQTHQLVQAHLVLARLHRLVERAQPSTELARTVDVVRMHVGREAALRLQVELDHRLGEGVRVPGQTGQLQHERAVVGAVDLAQRRAAGKVHKEERRVTQEAVREGDAAGVGGRVARAHELDALQPHPGVVGCAPEAALLGELAQEADHALRAVGVRCRQVDLVAEHHQPAAGLRGPHHHAARSARILAVVVEGLQDEVGAGGAAKVQHRELGVRQRAQRAGERHALAGAGRAAQQQRTSLGQPRAQHVHVSHRVHGRDHHVRRAHLVGKHVHHGHFVLPQHPAAVLLERRVKVEQRRVALLAAGRQVAAEQLAQSVAVALATGQVH